MRQSDNTISDHYRERIGDDQLREVADDVDAWPFAQLAYDSLGRQSWSCFDRPQHVGLIKGQAALAPSRRRE